MGPKGESRAGARLGLGLGRVAPKPRSSSLPSFLTAIVVLHHITCACSKNEWSGMNILACKEKFTTYAECFDKGNFYSNVVRGGGGGGRWGLGSVLTPPPQIGTWFLTLNQSYFMAVSSGGDGIHP